jgi:hypothetical protein
LEIEFGAEGIGSGDDLTMASNFSVKSSLSDAAIEIRTGRVERREFRVHARSLMLISSCLFKYAQCAARLEKSDFEEFAEKLNGTRSVVLIKESLMLVLLLHDSRIACAFAPPKPKLFTLARRVVVLGNPGHSFASVTISRSL